MRDQEIMAYADGELSPERLAAVEAALAADPVLRQRVEALRAMRRAARKVIREDTPLPPMSLARKIAAMAEKRPAAGPVQSSPDVAWRWPRWALAAAAVVVVGMMTAWLVWPGARPGVTRSGGGGGSSIAERSSTQLQARFTLAQNHQAAPLTFEQLQMQQYGLPALLGPVEPTQVAFEQARPMLAATACKALDTTVCLPDLFSQEYRYAGGEVLHIDGRPVIHLLYIGILPKKKGRLSIYMQRDMPAALPVGGIETVKLDEEGHTATAWHRGDVLCHVVADNIADARPAAVALASRLTDILR